MVSSKANRCGILQWDLTFDFRFTIAVPIAIGISFIISLPLWEAFLLSVPPQAGNFYHRLLHRTLGWLDQNNFLINIILIFLNAHESQLQAIMYLSLTRFVLKSYIPRLTQERSLG